MIILLKDMLSGGSSFWLNIPTRDVLYVDRTMEI